MWQQIPAVKNNHIVKVKAETYWYNDPYSLAFQRKELKNNLMK